MHAQSKDAYSGWCCGEQCHGQCDTYMQEQSCKLAVFMNGSVSTYSWAMLLHKAMERDCIVHLLQHVTRSNLAHTIPPNPSTSRTVCWCYTALSTMGHSISQTVHSDKPEVEAAIFRDLTSDSSAATRPRHSTVFRPCCRLCLLLCRSPLIPTT